MNDRPTLTGLRGNSLAADSMPYRRHYSSAIAGGSNDDDDDDDDKRFVAQQRSERTWGIAVAMFFGIAVLVGIAWWAYDKWKRGSASSSSAAISYANDDGNAATQAFSKSSFLDETGNTSVSGGGGGGGGGGNGGLGACLSHLQPGMQQANDELMAESQGRAPAFPRSSRRILATTRAGRRHESKRIPGAVAQPRPPAPAPPPPPSAASPESDSSRRAALEGGVALRSKTTRVEDIPPQVRSHFISAEELEATMDADTGKPICPTQRARVEAFRRKSRERALQPGATKHERLKWERQAFEETHQREKM